MSQSSIPVLKFLFRTDFKVLSDTLTLTPNYEVEEFPSAIDLATYLSTIPAGLVITSLMDKNDLVQVATLMKSVKKSAQQTAVKVVVINFSGDKQFEKAIAKLGIQDMVEPGVNTKALKFKLDFWMKSLNAQIKNNPVANLATKTVDNSKSVEKKNIENQGPTWSEPLELEDDIWILKQDNDCKKILSKWLIRLLGPSPYVGQWTELKNNLWRFDIKEEDKDLYVPGKGAWFFHGEQKPDFVWKENLWLISGESFDLFYKDEDQVFSRLKSKDKNLTICKNSLFAKTKEQIIIESCDKELVFKRSAEAIDDLEGKGKTDQLNGGPLSGKNKTSHLNQGPLSGDFNPNDDFLSSNPLSQKSQTDKQSGFWNGKLSQGETESKGQKGPASEGVREGAELGLDQKNKEHQKYYKNHNPAEQFDAKGKDLSAPLSGEVKEGQELGLDRKNNEHQKHYKGHNPAEQYEAERKEHERQKSEQKSSGPLAGKSSTDEFDGFYDNSKSKNSTSAEIKERELAGKTETDKMKSHYGGAISQDTPTKKEHSRSERDYPSTNRESEEQSASDPYANLFGKTQGTSKKESPRTKELSSDLDFAKDKNGVISLAKIRDERIKQSATEDAELEEACADAKVISVLTQNQRRFDCRLDDFYDDTIIMLTSLEGIQASSKIQLDMLFKYLNKDTKLNIEADVVTVDDDGEGNNYVTIQVARNQIPAVESFMKQYQTRQSNINVFMNKVKGF